MELGSLFVTVRLDGATQIETGLQRVNYAMEQARREAAEYTEQISKLQKFIDKHTEKDLKFTTKIRNWGVPTIKDVYGEVAQIGAIFKNIAARTDISTKALQKWIYAGKVAGISADEITSSFSQLQARMDDFKINGQANIYLNEVLSNTEGDLDRAIKDPMYLMKKISDYAQMEYIDKSTRRATLNNFGLSEDLSSAFMQGKFNKKKLNELTDQKLNLTKEEIDNLAFLDEEMRRRQEMARLSALKTRAKYAKFLKAWMKFTEGIAKVWEWIVDGFKGIPRFYKAIFKAIGKSLVSKFGVAKDFILEKGSAAAAWVKENVLGPNDKPKGPYRAPADGKAEDAPKKSILDRITQYVPDWGKEFIANRVQGNTNNSDYRVTVNQTNNFTNSDDNPGQIAKATRQAVNSDEFKRQQTAAMRGLVGAAET